MPNTREYLVTVSPPPPYGPDEVTTATPVLLTFESNTLYNITISLSACPERFNRTLIFGKISNTISNYNYICKLRLRVIFGIIS